MRLKMGSSFLNISRRLIYRQVNNAVEALVRWEHPEKGWVSPGAFIPIAEETGLIVPIGEWILETACKQTKKWQDEGIPNIGVAVNLSIRQFFQQNLVQMVEDILVRTKLSPRYLDSKSRKV